MTDIEKIRILHDLKKNFDEIPNDLYQTLESNIVSTELKNRIDQFHKNFGIEDNFQILFSALPWVKLIHKLDEEQLPPKSKEIYQVPDFLLFYENSEIKDNPIHIDVKTS